MMSLTGHGTYAYYIIWDRRRHLEKQKGLFAKGEKKIAFIRGK